MTNQEDAPLADKQAFLKCYTEARRKALTERNIRSSFRATGIYPINRNKGLSSPYSFPFTALRTPPAQALQYPEGDKALLNTPQNSRSIKQLIGTVIIMDRQIRGVVKKVANESTT